jgi:phage pi2 protein 07
VGQVLNIQIDEQEVRRMLLEKVEEKVKKLDNDLVFWDAKELMRRTGMSWGTIQTEFFFDPRFKKHKVGTKWRFPGEESKKFLLLWLSEQPRT